MSLKVLCAGCSQEERERAESDVRRALGARLQEEAWTVSLVKVNDRWSVTVSRPQRGTLTCVAPEGRVAEAIRDAVSGGPPEAAPAGTPSGSPAPAKPTAAAGRAPAAAASGPQSVPHQCGACHAAFVVRYQAARDEGEETVAVACPHCWHKNYVLIAESAAESREFTAEKA
jgi:hypothetical protein